MENVSRLSWSSEMIKVVFNWFILSEMIEVGRAFCHSLLLEIFGRHDAKVIII